MEDFPLTPAKASAGRLAALAATLNQNHPASAKDLANAQRCLTWGVPNLVPSSTMSHYQILQTPDYVVLVMEAVHDARIIPLDGRAHPLLTFASGMETPSGTGKAKPIWWSASRVSRPMK